MLDPAQMDLLWRKGQDREVSETMDMFDLHRGATREGVADVLVPMFTGRARAGSPGSKGLTGGALEAAVMPYLGRYPKRPDVHLMRSEPRPIPADTLAARRKAKVAVAAKAAPDPAPVDGSEVAP